MTADTMTTDTDTVLRAADSMLHTVHAWERWGNWINVAAGDDSTEIPYDAARLQVKLYTYPTAQIRVLRFHPKVRTHVHINKTDTVLYEWTSRRVQFVDDDAAICDPGTFSLHPKGVFHHGTVLTPGFTVEFAMEATAAPDPVPTFLPREDVPLQEATTPDGVGYRVRTATLGRYVVREVHLPVGASVAEHHDDVDLLLVVLSGDLRFSVDGSRHLGTEHDLGVEDTARVPRGHQGTLTALTDVVLLEALVPERG